MSGDSLTALFLTMRLALATTLLLLLITPPLAWWLSNSKNVVRPFVEAIVALPLVLPSTVLGFYLLIAFNPNAPFGAMWVNLTGSSLTFSFTGLVIASVIYSLPFAVQPLQTAFSSVDRKLLDAAASLGASSMDRFVRIAAPLSWRGFLTASVLSFAHTVGEFGIVLMVGGNIAGETRVISVAIFERVEALDYASAHSLSAFLLCFSFVVLLMVYTINQRLPAHVR